MVSRANIKHGITGALFFILFGALSACADLPTASGAENPVESCVWIEGIIHCRDT